MQTESEVIFKLSDVQVSDAGVYSLTLSNNLGETSQSVVLSIEEKGTAPTLEGKPQKTDVHVGDTIKLACKVTGT